MSDKDFVIENCVMLKYDGDCDSIAIPEGVTSIDAWAFEDFVPKRVVLPSSLVKSGGVFRECEGLEFNEYGNAYYLGTADNPYFMLVRAKNRQIDSCIVHENTAIVGSRAFCLCESLTEIAIPDSVRIIEDFAFFYCTRIVSLSIGAGVVSLGASAFSECHALCSVNYNAISAEDLGNYNNVFSSAGKKGDGITLTVGKSVEKIPSYLFYPSPENDDMPNLVAVDFEEGSVCRSIGVCAFFSCTKLNRLRLGESLEVIDRCAFDYCHEIRSLDIPDSVRRIEYFAFGNCGYLRNVRFGSGLEYIGEGAFIYCSYIAEIIIPDCVLKIDRCAFKDCTGLTELKLGKGVSEICKYAFANCYRLKTPVLPNDFVKIDEKAFGRD